MKKRATLAILIFSIVSAILPVATATSATHPVANTSCVTKGQSAVYVSKRFTCVISNKKLVWSTGVKVSVLPVISTTEQSPGSTTTIINQATVYTAGMTKPHQPVGQNGGKDDY